MSEIVEFICDLRELQQHIKRDTGWVMCDIVWIYYVDKFSQYFFNF